MDELKVIASISKRSESMVERVGATGSRSSNVLSKAARILKTAQFRRKLVHIPVSTQSSLTQTLVARQLDAMRHSSFLEHGPNGKWNWSEAGLELTTTWMDGETLSDGNHPREISWIIQPENLIARLRLWVRAFERLAHWHDAGVVHGNLKPQNILICDSLPSDFERAIVSEFFTPEENVPHISLLDGGWSHLLEASVRRDLHHHSGTDDEGYWRPPEGLSLVEGAVNPSSDVFTLSAILASDLGLIWREKQTLHGVLQCIWPLFSLDFGGILLHENKVVWQGRSPICDALKKLKAILAKVLNPLPESRNRGAREMAFELMVVARKLEESLATEPTTGFDLIPLQDTEILCTMRSETVQELMPVSPPARAMVRGRMSSNTPLRYWIVARNRGINVHSEMRRLTLHLALEGMHFLAFRVRHTEESFPFSALDAFISLLLTKIQRKNLQAIQEIKMALASRRQPLRLATEVLPSIRELMGDVETGQTHFCETGLTTRHESLHLALDEVVGILLDIALLDAIVVDDLQRSDPASLAVFIRMIQNPSRNILLWFIGGRSFDGNQQRSDSYSALLRLMNEDQHEDIHASGEKGVSWGQRLNSLSPCCARFLGALTTLPLPLTMAEASYVAADAIAIPGLIEHDFHCGKTSSPKIPHDATFTPDKETALPPKLDANTLAADALLSAKSIGVLIEEREAISGRIHSLHWVSERVSLTFSLLMPQKIRELLFLRTGERLVSERREGKDWSRILREAQIFLGTDPERTAHVTFSALMQASERLLDFDSCAHVATRLEALEEKLLQRRSHHAEALVPKIRERVADLAALRGMIPLATTLYTSVLHSTDDPSRRAVLALKAYSPSQLSSQEERTARFDATVHQATQAGLLPWRSFQPQDLERATLQMITTIEAMLTQKSALSGRELLVRPLASLIDLTDPERQQEGLVYPARSHSQRAQVLSQFARAAAGWVDSERVLALVLAALRAGLEERHGAVIAELLLTLCVVAGSEVPAEARGRMLRVISEVGSRTGNEHVVLESALMKAWFSYFFDGKIRECRRQLESLRARAADMPHGHKVLLERLRLLVEYDLQAREKLLVDADSRLSQLNERLERQGLGSWALGAAYLAGKPTVHAEASRFLEPTVPQLLVEQTDQALQYWQGSLSRGSHAAAKWCLAEIRSHGAREWIGDRRTRLTKLPLAIAEALTAQNQAESLRLDLGINDPETLLSLATAALQCGYQWLAQQCSAQAGMSLEALMTQSSRGHEEPAEPTVPPANEAVALNYVLELLHRLQWSLLEGDARQAHEFGERLERCIPPHDDLVEGTIAQAVMSAARRLKIHDAVSKHGGSPEVDTDERRTG